MKNLSVRIPQTVFKKHKIFDDNPFYLMERIDPWIHSDGGTQTHMHTGDWPFISTQQKKIYFSLKPVLH